MTLRRLRQCAEKMRLRIVSGISISGDGAHVMLPTSEAIEIGGLFDQAAADISALEACLIEVAETNDEAYLRNMCPRAWAMIERIDQRSKGDGMGDVERRQGK